MGLLSANSELFIKELKLILHLNRGTVNPGKPYEGQYFIPELGDYKISQNEAHKIDITTINERINRLFSISKTKCKVNINKIKKYHYCIKIEFENARQPIFKDIQNKISTIRGNKVIPFIPNSISETKNIKLVKSFIRGYFDLKGRVSAGDSIYKTIGGKRIFSSLRIGISFPTGAHELVNEFEKLLIKTGIDERFIEKELRDYREDLIRLDYRGIPNELFGSPWKKIFLKQFHQYFE